MSDECRVNKAMVPDEVGNILSHGNIVMARVMRRFAVVPEILIADCLVALNVIDP